MIFSQEYERTENKHSLWDLLQLIRDAEEDGEDGGTESSSQPVAADLTHSLFSSRGYKCFLASHL